MMVFARSMLLGSAMSDLGSFVRTVFILCAVLACVSTPSRSIAANDRPNIVFILVDDLRYDTFGFMDHPFVETPNIDSLASGGMRFENAFVTTSLCSPARASFLTGQYMHNHKVVNNADLMRAGTITFPQVLQKAGYHTAFIGKWHMGGSSDAPRPGFDHWVSFRGQGRYFPKGQKLNVNGESIAQRKYMTDELTDYAQTWIADQSSQEKSNRQKPFLLYLSHKGVHGLYDPAPRHLDRYQDADVSALIPAKQSVKAASGKPMWVHDQRNSWHGVEFPYHGRSSQTIAEMYRHYCEMILSIDDSVGRVLKSLREANVENDTLIIFTSDGGHLWGEHGLIDKRCAYEPSIRIPFLAYWPGRVEAGSISKSIVRNIDVAPTLIEFAKAASPNKIDGRSFCGELLHENRDEESSDELLYEYYWEPVFPQTPTTFSLRGPRYKLIQYHGIWDTDELYDLRQDPKETTNLINAPEHQDRVAAMRRRLHERLSDSDGLVIPLGFKRNAGANKRRVNSSKRAEFPDRILTNE